MNHLLFIGNLGAGEIIVIALVVLLLFGGKKIPELMKGLGKGVRSFKEGMNNIENDIENSGTEKEKKEGESASPEGQPNTVSQDREGKTATENTGRGTQHTQLS